MDKCINSLHSLRVRDLGVIAAVILGIGGLFFLAASYLFGPSERVSSLLSSRLALSPDALTAATMAVFCLLLGLAMLAGDRIFRRFLRQP